MTVKCTWLIWRIEYIQKKSKKCGSPCVLDDVVLGEVSFVEWDVYWSGNRVFHSCTDCDVIGVYDSTLSPNFNVIIVELWRREWDGF